MPEFNINDYFRPAVFGVDEKDPSVTATPLPRPRVAPTDKSKHILVIGGGVTGLTTAWFLLDRGFKVTILAKKWAYFGDDKSKGRLTSQIAGALWEFPPGGCGLTEIEVPHVSHSTAEQYRSWAVQSFDFFHAMHTIDGGKYGKEFGVAMRTLRQFFYTPITCEPHKEKFEAFEKFAETRPEFKLKDDTAELDDIIKARGINPDFKPELKGTYSHITPIVDTDEGMRFLMKMVRSKGAEMETRTIKGSLLDYEEDLLTDYQAHAIVNATGLGARELANDEKVFPVRGAIHRIKNVDNARGYKQITEALLVPAQLAPSQSNSGPDERKQPQKVVFIVPRNDTTLILGSLIQRNNDQLVLDIESPEVEQIKERCTKFMKNFEYAENYEDLPLAQGLRPFTHRNARVECETGGWRSRIVHNYGHGGSGWTLSVGCAVRTVHMIELLTGIYGSGDQSASDVNTIANVHEKLQYSTDEQWTNVLGAEFERLKGGSRRQY